MKKLLVISLACLVLFSVFVISEEDITSDWIKDTYKNIWYAVADLQEQINNIQLVAGPQGPAGINGTDGEQGPKGDTGDAGPAGPTKPLESMVVYEGDASHIVCCPEGWVRTGCTTTQNIGVRPVEPDCCSSPHWSDIHTVCIRYAE